MKSEKYIILWLFNGSFVFCFFYRAHPPTPLHTVRIPMHTSGSKKQSCCMSALSAPVHVHILSKGEGRGIHDLTTTVLLSLMLSMPMRGLGGHTSTALRLTPRNILNAARYRGNKEKKSQAERNVSADQCSTTHIPSSQSDLMVSIAGGIQGESWRQLLQQLMWVKKKNLIKNIFVIWAKHYWLFISSWERNIVPSCPGDVMSKLQLFQQPSSCICEHRTLSIFCVYTVVPSFQTLPFC